MTMITPHPRVPGGLPPSVCTWCMNGGLEHATGAWRDELEFFSSPHISYIYILSSAVRLARPSLGTSSHMVYSTGHRLRLLLSTISTCERSARLGLGSPPQEDPRMIRHQPPPQSIVPEGAKTDRAAVAT
eukprot:scaffold17793_cov131-Isochrysis_galbana.AAC.9